MDPKINIPNLACYIVGLDLLLLLALTWPKEIKAESYRQAIFGLVCKWAPSSLANTLASYVAAGFVTINFITNHWALVGLSGLEGFYDDWRTS